MGTWPGRICLCEAGMTDNVAAGVSPPRNNSLVKVSHGTSYERFRANTMELHQEQEQTAPPQLIGS